MFAVQVDQTISGGKAATKFNTFELNKNITCEIITLYVNQIQLFFVQKAPTTEELHYPPCRSARSQQQRVRRPVARIQQIMNVRSLMKEDERNL